MAESCQAILVDDRQIVTILDSFDDVSIEKQAASCDMESSGPESTTKKMFQKQSEFVHVHIYTVAHRGVPAPL